jgi:hypothetical protein
VSDSAPASAAPLATPSSASSRPMRPSSRPSPAAGFADAAELYVGLLLEANARMNLTRVVEPGAVARLHLLDALAALPDHRPDDARGRPRPRLGRRRAGHAAGDRPAVGCAGCSSTRSRRRSTPCAPSRRRCARERRVRSGGRSARTRSGHRERTTSSPPGPAPPSRSSPSTPSRCWRVGGAPRLEGPDRRGRAARRRAAPPSSVAASEVDPTGIEALGDHRFVIVRKERPRRIATRAGPASLPDAPSRRPIWRALHRC